MNEREFTVTEKLFIILAWKCNGMSMGAAYESWNDHRIKTNTVEFWKDSSRNLQDWSFGIDDLQQVSLEHLKFLGFRNWEHNHMLLPLWLFPQMRHEEEGWFHILTDEETALNSDTDLKVRGGCRAVYFKHDPVPVIKSEPERETLDEMFDDGLVLDPEAEAFINGISGGDEPGMSGFLSVEDMAAAHAHMLVHPLRDDEHQ
jgi:hypothetical protein